jgi:hypothetical protein
MNSPSDSLPSPPASVGAVGHKLLALAIRRTAEIIDGIDEPPTPEQRAAYWQQRDNYGKTGPQQGLPFTTDKDADNGC